MLWRFLLIGTKRKRQISTHFFHWQPSSFNFYSPTWPTPIYSSTQVAKKTASQNLLSFLQVGSPSLLSSQHTSYALNSNLSTGRPYSCSSTCSLNGMNTMNTSSLSSCSQVKFGWSSSLRSQVFYFSASSLLSSTSFFIVSRLASLWIMIFW